MASAQSENRPCLVLIAGVPGAGKTTFAKCVKQELEHSSNSCVLISFDDIVSLQAQKELAIKGKEMKPVRQKLISFVESYVTDSEFVQDCIDPDIGELVFPSCLPKNASYIVLDDNFYYRSMRYEFYQLARKHSLGFCQFFLSCPVPLALKQNAERPIDFVVPEEVIVEMASKFEMPDPMKNVWEQFSFVIPAPSNDEKPQLTIVLEMLKMAKSFPVVIEDSSKKLEMAENDRKLCSASVVHQADKVMRKIVNVKVKDKREEGATADEIKVYSRSVNEIRQKILEDMKCGVLLIDHALKTKIEERSTDALAELEMWLKEVYVTEQSQC